MQGRCISEINGKKKYRFINVYKFALYLKVKLIEQKSMFLRQTSIKNKAQGLYTKETYFRNQWQALKLYSTKNT